MSTLWKTELWRLLGVICISLIFGLVLESIAWSLAVGLLLYLFWQALQVRHLERWLDNDLTIPPYELEGIWHNLAYRIHQNRRRSRKRRKRMADVIRRFQKSTQALPDAAVVLTSNEEIEWINNAATRTLGVTKSDIGQNINNLLRSPAFHKFLRQGDYSKHLEINSPLDENILLDARIRPYGENQRLLVIRDITHIQHLMTMRHDLIANISHELRTPLTVILGYLEMLLNAPADTDPQTLRDQIAKLQSPTQRIQTLVDDLLMLSRLDTTSNEEKNTKIDIPSMAQQVTDEAQHISNGKHIIQCSIETDTHLFGIKDELHSAFTNLTNNAIRYTSEGKKISIRWYLNKDNNTACFEVKDKGIGIAWGHIPRLTERFYRVDSGRSKATGGTGLGLSIVEQILRRHGADLHIDSTPGRGSTFTCIFQAGWQRSP